MDSHRGKYTASSDNSQVGRQILLNYIEATATHYPNKPAVHQHVASEDGKSNEPQDVVLSYSNIICLVNKICWQLHDHGIPSGGSHVIAYLGPSDLRQLLISLVATKMGNQALLISPRASLSTLQELVRQSKASHLIFDCKFASIANEVSQTRIVETWKIADLLGVLRGLSATDDYLYDGSWATLRSSPATILHTTGSTGKPKLVPISHSTLAATDAHRLLSQKDPQSRKCQLEIMSEARSVYVAFPLFHVAGFALSCYLLFSGVTLMLGYPDQPPSTPMLRIALRDPCLDGALLPPSLVEDLSNHSGLMEEICKLSWIFSGGGSIGQKEGDAVVTKTRLFTGMGSTECGSFIQYPTDPSNWSYFHFHSSNGIYWRPVSPEADGEITEFELVVRREGSCEIYQSVFHNFPDLDEWHTKDVFQKHPTIEDLWQYRYRIDDVIVFSTGEKMNPVPLETRLSGASGIKAALAIGNNQRYPGLILEIDDSNEAIGSYSSLPSGLRDLVRDVLGIENAKSTRDGHIHESMILIASKGKPFVRTSKGTIHRNMTLNRYKTEIDALYHSLDLSNLTNLDQRRLDLTSESSLAADLTDLVIRIISNGPLLTADDDIFAAGLDSRQAQILTAMINKEFSFRREQDKDTLPMVDVSIIYASSTPKKLAQSILEKISSPSQDLEREREFYKVLQKHLRNIPTNSVSTMADCGETNGKHVLITGTTGFIGSHSLDALLRRKEVNRITCLNRKSPDSSSRIQTVEREDDIVTCEHIEADLSEFALGLPPSLYHNLLDSVTDILHCQWAVDFNRPLGYFERNIRGVNNLIRFACDTKHKAQIIFLSSVATVKNWPRPEPVPEVKLTSPEFVEMGYGQSKLIASLLLDQASVRANVPTTICRLGQVAGSITEQRKDHTQPWPRRDWFPTLLTASKNLGCIPDSLGSANEVDWTPVDAVAEALSDLICNSNVGSGRASDISQSSYYHFVNPNRSSYTELVPYLAKKLGKEEPLKVVSLREWVTLLADQIQGSGSFQSPISGITLLSFFQRLASSCDQSPLILDTSLTEKRLPRLRSIGAVSEEWMGMWLDQWDFI